MWALYAGLLAFAALAGVLTGTNNVTALSGALVGILAGVVSVMTIVDKIHVDAASKAKLGQLPAAGDTLVDARVKEIRRERNKDSTSVANTLGGLLLLIAIGFVGGAWAGHCWFDSSLRHIAEPWRASRAPAKFEEAVGWMALGDKLQKAGYSQEQIERIYAELGKQDGADVALCAAGRVWLGTAGSPAAGTTAAATPCK